MKRTDYTGQILDDRYIILKLLGFGGMGAVYLGKHIVLDKEVAVKFLHAQFSKNEEMIKRFYREAQAAAAIRHKNIIDVLDVGVSSENEPYLVMEYLQGESLADMLSRTGPFELPAACAILEPVLSALSAAHEKNIIHRDLKPENIFIADMPGDIPVVKLIDFGISKLLSSKTDQITRSGALLGTPAYMAPEQIVGSKNVDRRSDIYAMGVILYEMLTGKHPFKGDHYEAMIISVISEDPIPPQEAYTKIAIESVPLLMRILKKDPKERPQSAAALLEEIKTLTGYQQRHQQLSRYTCGINEKSFAVGALGPAIENGSDQVAREVLSKLTPKTTPTAWSKNIVQPKPNRIRVYTIGGVFGLLTVIGILVALLLWRGSDEAAPSSHDNPVGGREKPHIVFPASASENTASQRAAEQKPRGDKQPKEYIHLEINGAPENAVFFFDDVRYETSPIRVEKTEKAINLRVTAAGYKDKVLTIAPTKDYAIIVELEPFPQKNEARLKSDRIQNRTETPAEVKTVRKRNAETVKKQKTRSAKESHKSRETPSESKIDNSKESRVSNEFKTSW